VISIAGMDYKNAPLDIREKVHFKNTDIAKAYKYLNETCNIKYSVILSTCNRSEIYFIADTKEIGKKSISEFYKNFFNLSDFIIENYIYMKCDKQAMEHLFRVTSGYESMVLGEDQILGQVKEAYETAIYNRSSGKVLNRLFLDSITAAKKIKSTTGVSNHSISVSSIGVKLIENHMVSLKGKRALVIGLGEMTEIAIQYLMQKELEDIYVTNRTIKKSLDFTVDYPSVKCIDFSDRYKEIENIDILISCTSAPHLVIQKGRFLEHYKGRSLCILDLAVPRDIDPLIKNIPGVDFYEIDDLQKISTNNKKTRKKVMEKGYEIIEEGIYKYLKWLNKAENYSREKLERVCIRP